MNRREQAALSIFFVLGISLCALGALYLLRTEFMPYHARALQTSWLALAAHEQGFVLGMLRGLGAGALIAGVSTVFMAVAGWRHSITPYRKLLPLTAVGYTSLLGFATWTVATRTPGEPPLLLTAFAVAAALVASVLLWRNPDRR